MNRNDAHIDVSAEARAIGKAIRGMIAKGKAAGIDKPWVYIESEGRVYLMRPIAAHVVQTSERQAAIIGDAPIGAPYDVGSW
jgi:hypothetical protein